MNFAAIFDVVLKGMKYIPAIIQAGKDVAPAVTAITNLVEHAKAGTVTPLMVRNTHEVLDGLIEDFNEPLPD